MKNNRSGKQQNEKNETTEGKKRKRRRRRRKNEQKKKQKKNKEKFEKDSPQMEICNISTTYIGLSNLTNDKYYGFDEEPFIFHSNVCMCANM